MGFTDIPFDPLFEIPGKKPAAQNHLGLDPAATIILIAAGGYGIGPVEQLVRDLLALNRPWQIVAIARKSGDVKKKLDALTAPAGASPPSSLPGQGQKPDPRPVPVG